MSYPTGLDEYDEERLVEELYRRRTARTNGLCDYCLRPPSTMPCRFPERHQQTPKDPECGFCQQEPCLKLQACYNWRDRQRLEGK